MQYSSVLAIVAAALPTLSMAAQCRAVHYLIGNSASFGPGGTATSGNGIRVYGADGNQIGDYMPGNFDNPICQHTIDVDAGLPSGKYSGTTKCDTITIDSCSGSYSDQKDIGGSVNNDQDFYGIGISTSSQCQVLFDC